MIIHLDTFVRSKFGARHLSLALMCMLLWVTSGCGSSSNISSPGQKNKPGPDEDVISQPQDVGSVDATGNVGKDVQTADDIVPNGDVLSPMDDIAQAPEDMFVEPDAACSGCAGAPCSQNEECDSGWCLEGPEGPECAQSCVDA